MEEKFIMKIQRMLFADNKRLGRTIKAFKMTSAGSLTWNIYVLLRQKPFCPTHLRILMSDLLRLPCLQSKDTHKFSGEDLSTDDNLEHLQAAMDWLCYMQAANSDGGVATSYSFRTGCEASYPEVTGYMIPTFFNYFRFSRQEKYRRRAIKMANWLVSIQLPSGAFQGLSAKQPAEPRVFNTGQVLLGLIRVYKETGEERYMNSATKSADWLVSVQDQDGAWRRFSYNSIPHTYHTRVAWSLLELHQVTGQHLYEQAAVKNLQWAINNKGKNGWFKYNSFSKNLNPYTHNIVYGARGMLESGVLLNEPIYIQSAERTAEALFRKFEIRKFLPGDFNDRWDSQSGYSCLTGDAQLSILLMRLYELKENERYLNTALKINEYIRSTQILNSSNPGIRGAIKGSDPIWGNYASYSYPSWAVKFFVDSLLLEERIFKVLATNKL